MSVLRRRDFYIIPWVFLVLTGLGCHTGAIPGLEPAQASPTPTPTPTASLTPTLTLTPVVAPSRVPSPTAVQTDTPTVTPSFTLQPTITASFTPTDTPAPDEVKLDCDTLPTGGFGQIFQRDPALRQALGCPLGEAGAQSVQVAYQPFENGMMIWVSQWSAQGQKAIYTLVQDGLYRRYADTWEEGQPESGGEAPPEGRLEPVRGFGAVWREQPEVREWLGWALEPEHGGEGVIQLFQTGQMIYIAPLGQTYVFIQGPPARWQIEGTSF